MSTTLKRVGAVLFAAGLVFSAPLATAQAQSSLPTPSGSLDSGPPDINKLPPWAFEALHYGPVTQAEVDACWDELGEVIIMIYPGPCPNGPISQGEHLAAQALWFFTSRFGNLS
ncbi:hypothetical protein [Corynebacterium sp. A21]|uniref:hypothetical protein n=1 Tax=Corynebacterium sp. A21 TaxID=3457318 RepID=UPI003FD5BC8E